MDLLHFFIIFPFLFFLSTSSSAAAAATGATRLPSKSGPEVQVQSWIHRSFLDRAIRMLHKNGFVVAATALALRRTELLPLPEVTIFAPSDRVFFSSSESFRYDPRCHVVPERLHFDRMSSFTDGAEFKTLAPGKPVFIESATEAVTVNGIRIDDVEIYQNRWLVLYSMEPMRSFDDVNGESSTTGKLDESSSAAEIQAPVVSNDTIVSSAGESTNSGSGVFLLPPGNRTSVLPASDKIGKLLMPYIPNRFPAQAATRKLLDQIEVGSPAPASCPTLDLEDAMGSPAVPQFPLINKSTTFHGNASVITSGNDVSEMFCQAPDDQIQIPTEPPARGERVASFDLLMRLLTQSQGREKRVPDHSPNMATHLPYYPEFACSSLEFGSNIL